MFIVEKGIRMPDGVVLLALFGESRLCIEELADRETRMID